MKHVGAKFFAKPKSAIGCNGERFDIEVCACEKAIARTVVDNLERNFFVRVRELNEALDVDASITVGFSASETGIDLVDSQQEICAVALCAVAIVWHEVERIGVGNLHRTKALDRLLWKGCASAIGGIDNSTSRSRPIGKGVRREWSKAFKCRARSRCNGSCSHVVLT